ncbi:MAG: hypothetical protein RBT45_05170, partial [Acholeplasmataceae bacterium]|nr:hypothetical protein [Acholeplasmataceae bacterium]
MILSLIFVGILLIPLLVLLIKMKRFLIAIRLIGIYIWVSITIMVMPYFRVFETSLYPFESVLHTMKSMVLNNDSSVVQYFAAQDV